MELTRQLKNDIYHKKVLSKRTKLRRLNTVVEAKNLYEEARLEGIGTKTSERKRKENAQEVSGPKNLKMERWY